MSRINTNISALQAIHQLSQNQQSLTTSLQRLSTGLRINNGADDPAGLIASESLRSEIRGLTQAIANSERAINVIATADAALGEVSSMLLEIKQLVNQSANSGALSEAEINANQLQVDALLEGINRIANSTQFNGRKLLNGELSYTVSGQNMTNIPRLQVFGARVPSGSALSVTVQVTQSAQTGRIAIGFGGATGFSGDGRLSSTNNVTIEVRGNRGTEIFSFAGGTSATTIAQTINSFKALTGVSARASAAGLTFNSTRYGSDEFVSVRTLSGNFDVAAGDQGDYQDAGRDAGVLINGQTATVDGLVASIRSSGLDVVVDLSTAFGTAIGSTSFGVKGGGAQFQIGPQVNTDGLVSIGVPGLATAHLGNSVDGYLFSLGGGGNNSLVSGRFEAAESIISSAIEQIATQSGRLGGFQANQLETNINSRRVALENVKAAESAIRDTDYSSEVSQLTRAQVLLQSTTQMLSIANQIPQTVLALLG